MKFVRFFCILAGFAAALGNSSCGLEDYPYLFPVPSGNIRQELISQATVLLPAVNLSQYYYFTHYSVYYRIYVSDQNESGTIQLSRENLSRINSYLSTDYFALEPYLASTDTRVNTSIASQFRSRNYYPLKLEGWDIDSDVLGRNVASGDEIPERTMVINFYEGSNPTMILRWGNTETDYVLWRSNGDGVFNPRPNRYFINNSELYEPANITATVNADVSNNPSISSGPKYTYVSMYIVAVGLDPATYSLIFSTPAFIGILRLPDPLNG